MEPEDEEEEEEASESDEEEKEEQHSDDGSGGAEMDPDPNAVGLNEFDVGWHHEMGLGWRLQKGASQAQKEISLAPNPLCHVSGTSKVVVEFLDGTTAVMPLTVAGFKKENYARASSWAEVLLVAEHKETHHKISIR